MEHLFNDTNFEEEVLKSNQPVLVDFWAVWCGPCQLTRPFVEELAKEYEGKNIKIGNCNVDENQTVVSQYNILSIPIFAIFKQGKMIDQLVGGVQKEKLKELIDKNIE